LEETRVRVIYTFIILLSFLYVGTFLYILETVLVFF